MNFTPKATTSAQQVKEENPDMKITEMSKVLGARWREMDEKQKAPYQKKADADKARSVEHQQNGMIVRMIVINSMLVWVFRQVCRPAPLRKAVCRVPIVLACNFRTVGSRDKSR